MDGLIFGIVAGLHVFGWFLFIAALVAIVGIGLATWAILRLIGACGRIDELYWRDGWGA